MEFDNPTERQRAATLDGLAEDSASRSQMPTLRDSAIPLTLRRMLPGIVVFLMVVSALAPVSDPDTFWHIATGDYLRETWRFNGPDPWSSQSTLTWRLHEWLPQLVMSVAQQWGGVAAVAWLLPAGAAAVLLILWITLRERASLPVTALVMTCSFLAMSNSFSLRPHLVTFALTIVVTGAWLRTASDLRPRWWLVPLSWVWACSHGMWFVGVAIGCVTVVGMVCDGSVTAGRGLRLGLVPLAAVAVATVTPVGPALLLSPLEVRGYTRFVQEWLPPSLGDGGFLFYLVLSSLCFIPWLRMGRRVAWTHILLAGMSIGLALAYIRTVPLAAGIMAPLAAASLQAVSGIRRERLGRREVAITVLLATSGLALAGALSPSRASSASAGASELSPALEKLSPGTVVCNEYGLGGWLIWRHPQLRPTIDGRTEIYSLDSVEDYMRFRRAEPTWERYLVRTGCTYALLGVDVPATGALQGQEGWTVVAKSDSHVLMVAPTR